jgi:hypothetical protein
MDCKGNVNMQPSKTKRRPCTVAMGGGGPSYSRGRSRRNITLSVKMIIVLQAIDYIPINFYRLILSSFIHTSVPPQPFIGTWECF